MVRFKNRYLLFEIIWKDGRADDALGEAALLAAVRESVLLNFGDAGAARAGGSLQVKYVNPRTGLAVLRCGRADHRLVWCATTLLASLRGRRALLQLVHLAGTLRSCQRAALRYDAAILRRLRRSGALGAAGARGEAAEADAAARIAAMEM